MIEAYYEFISPKCEANVANELPYLPQESVLFRRRLGLPIPRPGALVDLDAQCEQPHELPPAVSTGEKQELDPH